MKLRTIITVLSAILLSSLVAPWYFAPLHWGAYLPLFWALREETPKENRRLLLLYGTVAEGLIFAWITETIALFSNIPWPGAVAINVLFAFVFGLRYAVVFGAVFPLRKRLGDLWILALPAWLVLVEYLLMKMFLFPYNQGISQYRTPFVWQVVSVTGVWGLSYLVLFFNACFAEWIFRRREGRDAPVRWMISAVAVLAAVVGFGAWRYGAVEATLTEAPVKRIHQLQSKQTMTERMSMQRSDAFKYWVESTRALPRGAVDLSVWPEGACPYQLNESLSGTSALWKLTQDLDVDLIVGAGTREREADPAMGEKGTQRVFNSVYAFFRGARRVATPGLTPAMEWPELVSKGCNLDAAHVWLPLEAAALAGAGQSAADAPDCVARLQAREQELRAVMKVDPTFEGKLLLTFDGWAAIRAQTARFARVDGAYPLAEAGFGSGQNKSAAYWVLHEAGCKDSDCRGIWSVCTDAQTCTTYPDAPHYDKMVPLPFGEYMPLASTFPWIADLIEGPGNFRAGTEAVVFEQGELRIATPICYEGILGYVCDQFEKPDVFVNVTNDAWFGTGAASALHGMLVAARATELGVPVFRSTYSGTSFVVEPHGRIYAETGLFEDVSRVVNVRLGKVDTFYGRWGDWFVGVCLVGFVGLLALARRSPVG
jgi:apolipoprotein N-acyltransferase